MSFLCNKFHLRLVSPCCVFLSLLQLSRKNHYAKCQILMYKRIFIANNFSSYINSQQRNLCRSLLLQFAACKAKNRNHCNILANFSWTPTSISKLTTPPESQQSGISNDVLAERKSYQIFSYERIHFSDGDETANPILTSRHHPRQKLSPSSCGTRTSI